MDVSDQDVEAFSASSPGKALNDRNNKSREKLVSALLNSPNADLDSLRLKLRNREILKEIVVALHHCLKELAIQTKLPISPNNISVNPRGGRGNNHDFDLVISVKGSDHTLAIELKKGKSIFNQPQILSLYVNSPNVLSGQIKNYAEFFFDEYFERLRKHTGCQKIAKSDYLTGIWGTSYESPPFSQLYELAKYSVVGKNWLKQLQYESVDAYLRYLVHILPCPINWEPLQERLFQQLPKYFLSWNSQARTFKWEQFSRNELTLTGKVETKAKRTGQLTSIVLPTETGQRLEMLLRWKNNPCVKGPAWQIKLTPA